MSTPRGIIVYARNKAARKHADSVKQESQRMLYFLAANPVYAHGAVNTAVLQQMMFQTSGSLLALGVSWDIVSKRLAPGVYRVSLKERG